MIGRLPVLSRGFDCNTKLTPAVAQLFVARKYRFVMRYVPRRTQSMLDLTAAEAIGIHRSGLAIGIVQHVAMPYWVASATLGMQYGMVAAQSAHDVGCPPGVTVWCDLEGVSSASSQGNVVAYCNAWYDQVRSAGYDPGLYVGDRCGLTAQLLYSALRFKRYWSAYNLNRDEFPAVRGVQMMQKQYPSPANRVAGCPFEYDEDIVYEDAFGSSPTFWFPDPIHP